MEESNDNELSLSNATSHQLNLNAKSEASLLSENDKFSEAHLRDTESTIIVPKNDIKLTYFKCTEV